MHGAYLPPSYHQTVKQHLLPTLNLSHIGVLIIDSLLYRQQNATEITEHRRIDGIKPSLRFDRLSHLIITLKHWEEGRSGGEYALDSCTSKGVSVLNIFKALCLENIILYFFFFFFRFVGTRGLSEIEVTTDFKRQNFGIQNKFVFGTFHLRCKQKCEPQHMEGKSADTVVLTFNKVGQGE